MHLVKKRKEHTSTRSKKNLIRLKNLAPGSMQSFRNPFLLYVSLLHMVGGYVFTSCLYRGGGGGIFENSITPGTHGYIMPTNPQWREAEILAGPD